MARNRPTIEIKLPFKIEIGGHTYTIKWGDSDDMSDKCLWGEHNGRTKIITLEKRQVSSEHLRCFFHECNHAINQSYMNSEHDEDTINNFAEGTTQILKQLINIRFV